MICADGYWASSTAFSADNPAVVSTSTTADDIGYHEYWAFICDDDLVCSLSYYSFFSVGQY